MTLKIGVGLSFYNDFESLRRMLQSLQSYPIDHLIAVDGRYKGHQGKEALSNDETLDLFDTIQTPHIIYQAPNYTQIAKRNMYFELSQDHDLDVLIVMDSDDFIVHDKTNWPLFVEDLESRIHTNEDDPKKSQSYCIPVRGYHIQGDRNSDQVDSDTSPVTNILRVFYKPHELEYYDNHYTIRNKHTKLSQYYHSFWITVNHLMLAHDHALRTPEHNKQMSEYEKQEEQYEKAGRYVI